MAQTKVTTPISEADIKRLRDLYWDCAQDKQPFGFQSETGSIENAHTCRLLKMLFGVRMFQDIDNRLHPCPHRFLAVEYCCRYAAEEAKKLGRTGYYDISCHYMTEPCRDILNPNKVK